MRGIANEGFMRIRTPILIKFMMVLVGVSPAVWTAGSARAENCDLFPVLELSDQVKLGLPEEGRQEPFPQLNPSASHLWAQEFIGGDLVRERLIAKKYETSIAEMHKKLIAWDTSENDHGIKVANLMMGPTGASMIPYSVPAGIREITATDGLDRALNEVLDIPKRVESRIVNFSCLIPARVEPPDALREMILVSGAGNENATLAQGNPFAFELNQDKNRIILVASMEFNTSRRWKTSDYLGSNFGEGITITAPGDLMVLSAGKSGNYSRFGGTSAATAMVSAALAVFEIISGYELSLDEAIRLLQKTALPHVDKETQGMGAGTLNAYKISELASRWRGACAKAAQPRACIKGKLADDAAYEILVDFQELLKNGRIINPSCIDARNAKPQNPAPTCKQKQDAFKALRRDAHLAVISIQHWNVLVCITSQLPNAIPHNIFYYGLSVRNQADHEERMKIQKANQKN